MGAGKTICGAEHMNSALGSQRGRLSRTRELPNSARSQRRVSWARVRDWAHPIWIGTGSSGPARMLFKGAPRRTRIGTRIRTSICSASVLVFATRMSPVRRSGLPSGPAPSEVWEGHPPPRKSPASADALGRGRYIERLEGRFRLPFQTDDPQRPIRIHRFSQ